MSPPTSDVDGSASREPRDRPSPPSVPFSPHLSPSLSTERAQGVLILSDQSEVLLYDGDNLVGTSLNSTVRLQSANVSCEHAVITFDNSSMSPTIEDLSSKMGSFLNGRRLTGFRALSLHSLDKVVFGDVSATYYSIDQYLNMNS